MFQRQTLAAKVHGSNSHGVPKAVVMASEKGHKPSTPSPVLFPMAKLSPPQQSTAPTTRPLGPQGGSHIVGQQQVGLRPHALSSLPMFDQARTAGQMNMGIIKTGSGQRGRRRAPKFAQLSDWTEDSAHLPAHQAPAVDFRLTKKQVESGTSDLAVIQGNQFSSERLIEIVIEQRKQLAAFQSEAEKQGLKANVQMEVLKLQGEEMAAALMEEREVSFLLLNPFAALQPTFSYYSGQGLLSGAILTEDDVKELTWLKGKEGLCLVYAVSLRSCKGRTRVFCSIFYRVQTNCNLSIRSMIQKPSVD